MHSSSYNEMKKFVLKYLPTYIELKVLDIGSQIVKQPYYDSPNSYKYLIDKNFKYIGMDIEKGENVDIVVEDPYSWSIIEDNSFDVVISGSALEHMKFPWLAMKEIHRVLKKDGLCCVIAPSAGFIHQYPIDCYRYFVDGMRALAEYAGIEVLECYTNSIEPWKDTVLIGKK